MILYDWVLSLGFTFLLPKILLKGKSPTLRQRFGWDLPPGKEVIWIHAVSVGEVKSAQGLLAKLRTAYPHKYILVTTCTATGLAEAKRSLSQADGFYFLPTDFSWTMRKWVVALKPSLLLFVETDLWYNLLRFAHDAGCKIVLVSGKISERSARRFQKVPFFAKKIFSLLDLGLVQNEEHQKRLQPWIENLHIGGNLKLDAVASMIDKVRWSPYFQGQNLLITCTHDPEEAELLTALETFEGTIYLAPRHPERFNVVADILESRKIPYIRWSQIDLRTGAEKIILIDGMGLLPIFYTFCDLTIVAGSFSSAIGGHNVLEPCLYGSPVLFGPAMDQQSELAARVLNAHAGLQTTTANLIETARAILLDSKLFRQGAEAVTNQSKGALEQTWHHIQNS